MARNILLIGSRGQVGWELMRTLQPLGGVTGVDFPEIDLVCPESIQDWIGDVNPQVIVNAAAYTAVDRAESEPEKALAINGVAPGIVAEVAKRRDCWLVHFSTDYVFDGSQRIPYTEEMDPRPVSVYGRSKLAADEAIRQVGGRHLIFRLCWVYGARGQNFLRTMLRLITTREELRVVDDQVGCPTWSRLIAEATTLALARALQEAEPERMVGLYNLACGGQGTWHELTQRIWERIPAHSRRARPPIPIPSEQYPVPAPRPAWSVLDCGKLERVFGIRLPDWKTALDLVFGSPIEGFEALFATPGTTGEAGSR